MVALTRLSWTVSGILVVCFCLLYCANLQAAPIIFYLGAESTAPATEPVIQVTIEEIAPSSTLSNGIKLTVETLPLLNDQAGNNFGINKFYFNLDSLLGSFSAEDVQLLGNASDWKVFSRKNAPGIGFFDVLLSGQGHSRTSMLEFTLSNISLSEVNINSNSNQIAAIDNQQTPDADYLFAARVTGLHPSKQDHGGMKNGADIFVGPVVPIPVPTALLLFGSGLLGFSMVARRQRENNGV